MNLYFSNNHQGLERYELFEDVSTYLGLFFLVIGILAIICWVSYNSEFLIKAEEAARESRHTKQDRYTEMRRRKDEEREAIERKLVGLLPFIFFCYQIWHSCTDSHVYLDLYVYSFLVKDFGCGLSRKKKLKLGRLRRKKLLHWSLRSGKGSFLLMLKGLLRMKSKMEVRAYFLIL